MTFSHLCAPDVHYERRFLLFYSIEQHLFVQKQQASRVSHFGTQANSPATSPASSTPSAPCSPPSPPSVGNRPLFLPPSPRRGSARTPPSFPPVSAAQRRPQRPCKSVLVRVCPCGCSTSAPPNSSRNRHLFATHPPLHSSPPPPPPPPSPPRHRQQLRQPHPPLIQRLPHNHPHQIPLPQPPQPPHILHPRHPP